MNVLVLVGSLRAGSPTASSPMPPWPTSPRASPAPCSSASPTSPTTPRSSTTTTRCPQVARDLREAVADADAVLLVTPEYNGSLPSALKNAVDWVSRPRGTAAMAGKPAAVIGASGSPNAAKWAREDGVKVLRVAGAEVIEDTVGVGASFQAFEDGRLGDAALDAELRTLVGRLARAVQDTRSAA